MEIAENNAHRVTLVEDKGLLGAFVLLCCLVIGALFTAVGTYLLFGEVSELVAPGWAESEGWSGLRWRNEGSDLPTSLAGSAAISLFWVVFSLLFLWLGATGLLFTIRKRLVFDFEFDQTLLSCRGLLRRPDRT